MEKTYNPRSMTRLLALVFGLMMSALIAACGGGTGAGAGGGGGNVVGSSSAADMQLTTNVPTVGSAGQATVSVTAIVKDSSSRALANQVVNFAVVDPDAAGSFLSGINATTGTTGTATATLNVTGKSNRTITISATSGSITRTTTVVVVGTSITLNGPSSVVTAGTVAFTVALKDSSQTPIANALVTITPSAGLTAPATATTDGSGQAQFNVTANSGGNHTLQVAALGATTSATLTASGSNLTFSAPAANAEVAVNAVQPITLTFAPSVGTGVGQTIQFTATRGTLSAASAVTNGASVATVNVSSPNAGLSTITATAPDGTSTTRVIEFVSTTASTISLQASPSSVGANIGGSTANASQLIARVRDATGNPVKGVRVDFTQVVDPSGGQVTPGFATTDSSGVATSSFIAGPNSSGFNAVQLRSTVFGTGITSTSNLTVAQLQMFVEIGTGNELETPDSTKFRKAYTALVTDSNGAPVANAVITASLTPLQFYKGQWVVGGTVWAQNRTQTCVSEDANTNSVLDAGEDVNSNGKLDPGNPSTVTITSTGAVTDANGFANLAVTYPRNYAQWVQVRLQVTITSQGTEGRATAIFDLPALASDIQNITVEPPGRLSPFGIAAGCNNTN